jgi:soluble lytic murein transglycosylase
MEQVMAKCGFPIAVSRAGKICRRKARALRLPSSNALSGLRPAGRRTVTTSASLIWCLSAGSALYALIIFSVMVWVANSQIALRSSKGMGSWISALTPAFLPSSTRDEFLRRINFEHKRDLVTQINYVANKISKVGKVSPPEAASIAKAIVLESRNQNIDPLFVAAVIKTESTFKTHAVSNRGATGLMQIMPATGRYLSLDQGIDWDGHDTLKDPSTNIRLGITYLKQLKESFGGNTEHALIAYNWGPSNLNRALRNSAHIPSSTVKYARGVMSEHRKWSSDLREQVAQFRYMDSESLLG